MTATAPSSPNVVEPPREDEYIVPLTGRRRARHLARLLEAREMFAKLSTERYSHGLADAADAFTQMANIEEEIATLYPDVHSHLFPQWVSTIADMGHDPGQYNAKCGICRAHRPGTHLHPAA